MIGEKKIGLRDLVPQEWSYARGEGGLLQVCYRVMVANQSAIPNPIFVEALGCLVAFIWGRLPKHNTISVIKNWTISHIEAEIELEETETETGAHLVCLTPCDAANANEVKAAGSRIQAAVGLAMMVMGENAAHSLVFESMVGADNRTTTTTTTLRIPILYPDPGLPASADMLRDVAGRLAGLDEAPRQRISHALRWLSEGMKKDGSDALLAMWIGLEILAMPNTTDIRPINERLAKHYSLDLKAATQRFHVGKLFGLRSKIVHQGFVSDIPSTIPLYMRSIFVDCLAQELGIQSRWVEDVTTQHPILEQLAKLNS